MISYEIIVHCICGTVKTYSLNAFRSKIVVIGREEKVDYPHISLHSEDLDKNGNSWLSSTTLYFAFDKELKDWVVGSGFPAEKYWCYDKNIAKVGNKMKDKQIGYVFTIDSNKMLFSLNQRILESLRKDEYIHSQPYNEYFTQLKNNKTECLQDVSGVGIWYTKDEIGKTFKYKGKEHLGIKHPILPEIPFHWYIEINNNHSNTTALQSYIEKTKA